MRNRRTASKHQLSSRKKIGKPIARLNVDRLLATARGEKGVYWPTGRLGRRSWCLSSIVSAAIGRTHPPVGVSETGRKHGRFSSACPAIGVVAFDSLPDKMAHAPVARRPARLRRGRRDRSSRRRRYNKGTQTSLACAIAWPTRVDLHRPLALRECSPSLILAAVENVLGTSCD